MPGSSSQITESYVNNLTKYQPHLQGYIFASLGNHADAEDVLQRTNLTLLKKEPQFPSDGEFLPWAIAIAKYEILSYIRDVKRSRTVFSPTIVELMCDTAEEDLLGISDRQEALRQCLKKLPEQSRKVLSLRYANDHSIEHIAELTGRSLDGVKSLLFRLRRKLETCVKHGLTQELR